MAAVLMAAGAKDKRYGLPNSRFLLHQPSISGLAGQATDIDIQAREILRMREKINQILAHHSGPKSRNHQQRRRARFHSRRRTGQRLRPDRRDHLQEGTGSSARFGKSEDVYVDF